MTCNSHVERSGSGNAIVLIHGVGLDLRMWDEVVEALAGRFELIRYDMLGHGATPPCVKTPTLDDYVRQLEQLLQEQALYRPSIVGYSMGGLIAGEFAARHPDKLDRLILMSTIFRRSEAERRSVLARLARAENDADSDNARSSIERWFSPAYIRSHEERISAFRKRLLTNSKENFLAAYRIFAASDETLPSAGPRIKCPTLVVTGEHDAGSTPVMAEALANAISDAKLEIVPEQKHMLPVESPETIAGLLTKFLSSDIAVKID